MSYRALLRTPGLPTLAVFSGLGRLGLAVAPLALIIAVADTTSSFTAAGTSTAALALASATLAPARAWLVDRYGPQLAVTALGLACAAGFVTLVAIHRPHTALLLMLSAISGAFTPPLGAPAKALLSIMFETGQRLQLAYSFDTVLDIAVLVAGPALAGGIIAATSPDAALAAAAGLILLGSTGTAMGTLARRHHHASTVTGNRGGGRNVIRNPVIQWAAVSICGAGAAIGAIELIVPALATQHNARGRGNTRRALRSRLTRRSALRQTALGHSSPCPLPRTHPRPSRHAHPANPGPGPTRSGRPDPATRARLWPGTHLGLFC